MKKLINLILGMSIFFIPLLGEAIRIMNSEGIKEAIEYGKANKKQAMHVFWAEWDGERKGGTLPYVEYSRASCLTGFKTIAYKARTAAIQHREPSSEEIEKNLHIIEGAGQLRFLIVVAGDNLDFAKDYHAILRQGKSVIQPITKNILPARLLRGSGSPYYVCPGIFEFRRREIDLSSPVRLIVINLKGEEAYFDFDLGKIR